MAADPGTRITDLAQARARSSYEIHLSFAGARANGDA